MNKFSPTIVILLLQLLAAVLSELPCDAHNENVHLFITKSAFYSSSGLNVFLSDNLNSLSTPLTAQPHGYAVSSSHTSERWLEWGAYYEDMEDRIIKAAFDSPRAQDHFYTLTFQPPRTPGQVIGITDSTEFTLGGNGTNSFAWAAIKGITPVSFAGFHNLVNSNDQTWPDARSYQFAALTNATKSSREENLALMLDSLGHVLHLNQDLTSPDHVRNDNHYNEAHRFIENYGQNNYTRNSQWFNQQSHGWAYWQGKGFSKLLDFWDRGHYTGSASDLNSDADGSQPLGLAEFSNGNFLGEDALYAEYFPDHNDIHYFPYPSLNSGTTFPAVRASMASGVTTTFLKDGRPIQRIRISKIHDGITINNHSMLNYLGTQFPRHGGVVSQVSSTINDPAVLQEYHDKFIPKAVEYSAGLLDYFFRGQLSLSLTRTIYQDDDHFTIGAQNTSGQTFSGGTFFLYQEDAAHTRTLLYQTNLSGTLPDGDSETMVVPSGNLLTTNTTFILIYQGTIGVTGGVTSDPVDTGIAIAAKTFGVYANNEFTFYQCVRTAGDYDFIPYEVPAGTAYSPVSEADAEGLAYQIYSEEYPTDCN